MVGRGATLDFRGAGGQRFHVEACGLVGIGCVPFYAEESDAALEFALCFIAAQEPDFLDGVVERCCAA
jgi:hypothetical protein